MAKIPRSADMLVNLIMSRPGEIDKLKNDPEKTLKELAQETTTELLPPVLKREAGIYYIVVIAIGIVAVLAIAGAIYLSAITTAGSDIKMDTFKMVWPPQYEGTVVIDTAKNFTSTEIRGKLGFKFK